MANPDAAFGFRPLRHLSGGTPGRTNEYPILTAYDTSLFSGDIVKSDGAGNIAKAVAGDPIRGVFAGVKWIGSDGSIEYRRFWTADTVEQAGSVIQALVFDDPNITLEVQASTSVVAANLGLFVNLLDGTGDSTTGQSRQEIGTFASTETQFRMNRIIIKPIRNAAGNQANSAAGLNAIIEVSINNHELGKGVVAAEV